MVNGDRASYLADVIANFYIKDGVLMRKHSKNVYVLKDTPAGNFDELDGLLKTKMNGLTYRVHRLMYQLYNNVEYIIPEMPIVHLDGNKLNNSKENLELVDSFEKNHLLKKYSVSSSGYNILKCLV